MKQHDVRPRPRARRPRILPSVAIAAAMALPWAAAGAQTDYFNTDAGRPLTVQDASVIERHVIELQAAPVRLERASGGRYSWGVEPELAWGVLSFTQLEVGLPLVVQDGVGGADRRAGVAGVHLSLLHSLNTESRTLPAFALGAATLLPAGPLAPSSAYGTFTGVMTRSFGFGRVHLNGSATVGPTPRAADDEGAAELSRWEAGLAVDRALPFRSTLIAAELVARHPLDDAADLAWQVGAGVRRQLDPRWVLDAGLSRTVTGDHRPWSLTVGAAYAFAVPALMGITGGR
ncbi:MAG TPA: hypothetical protein VGE02_04005 [Gemmatimonadales bacterium]